MTKYINEREVQVGDPVAYCSQSSRSFIAGTVTSFIENAHSPNVVISYYLDGSISTLSVTSNTELMHIEDLWDAKNFGSEVGDEG